MKGIAPMKTNNTYTKIVLLLVGAVMFKVASARADTYSWTNLQSDIPGVAQHVDPNLVNPWGMAASSTSSMTMEECRQFRFCRCLISF
jgi:hypothetical protein